MEHHKTIDQVYKPFHKKTNINQGNQQKLIGKIVLTSNKYKFFWSKFNSTTTRGYISTMWKYYWLVQTIYKIHKGGNGTFWWNWSNKQRASNFCTGDNPCINNMMTSSNYSISLFINLIINLCNNAIIIWLLQQVCGITPTCLVMAKQKGLAH